MALQAGREVMMSVVRGTNIPFIPNNNENLQSIIQTDIGREEFGSGMTAFWRRIVDEPDAFPREFWQLFL